MSKLSERIEAWVRMLPPETCLIEFRDGPDGEPPVGSVPVGHDDRTSVAAQLADLVDGQCESKEAKVSGRLLAYSSGADGKYATAKLNVTRHYVPKGPTENAMEMWKQTPTGGQAEPEFGALVVKMYAQHTNEALTVASDVLAKGAVSITTMMDRLEKISEVQNKIVDRLFARFDALDAERAAEETRRRETEALLDKQTDNVNTLIDQQEKEDAKREREPMVERLAKEAFSKVSKHVLKSLPGGLAAEGEKAAGGVIADAAKAAAEAASKEGA